MFKKILRPSGSLSLLAFCAIATAFTGCGKAPETVRETGQFEPYVLAFESQAAAHGRTVTVDNIAIRFGQTSSASERAVCVMAGDETPTITVRQAAWDSSTEAEREELIFHELGHCVLRRKHLDNLDSDGAPQSVMHSIKIDGYTYSTRQAHYLRELFSGSADF